MNLRSFAVALTVGALAGMSACSSGTGDMGTTGNQGSDASNDISSPPTGAVDDGALETGPALRPPAEGGSTERDTTVTSEASLPIDTDDAATSLDAGTPAGDARGAGDSGDSATPATACPSGMVPIPAKNQSFMMGLNANEAPLQANGMPWACYLGKHQVTFTYDLCMDAKLVTQAQFSALMGFNPSVHKTADATLPVDSETWYDAVLYCNKKSEQDGLQPAYSYGAVTLSGMTASNITGLTVDLKKNGYRLPTNAEYEYAERANTTGLYFFSPTVASNITALGAVYAWYSVNSGGVTQPVGRLKPNPWGLYDIVGNLFEWEYDWEGPYATTPEVDPLGPATGTGCGGFDIGIQRMAKGGSWHTDVSTHMRISYHYKWPPAAVHAELGFRCVATAN